MSPENGSKNWRLDMVEVLYKEGLHARGAVQDLVPIWRGLTPSNRMFRRLR